MKKDYSGIPAKVYPVIEKAVCDLGCFIWDVEFVKEGADRILRITIDTDDEGGIDINRCVDVHHAVDPLLDEADPIDESYSLQISSPGIERSLTMPWHVDACRGEKAELRLFAPVNGKRVFTGVISGMDGDDVVISDGENELRFSLGSVSKMKLLYDFED